MTSAKCSDFFDPNLLDTQDKKINRERHMKCIPSALAGNHCNKTLQGHPFAYTVAVGQCNLIWDCFANARFQIVFFSSPDYDSFTMLSHYPIITVFQLQHLGYRTIVIQAKRSEQLSGHGILEVPNEALFQLKHDSPPSIFLLVKRKGRVEFLPRGLEPRDFKSI